jgi:hypothetical protein
LISIQLSFIIFVPATKEFFHTLHDLLIDVGHEFHHHDAGVVVLVRVHVLLQE